MAHLLALIVLWSLPVSWTIRSGLSAVVLASMALSVRQALRLGIVALRVNVKGEFSIRQRDGDWLEATLLGTSFVAPYLTVLNLRLSNKRWPQHVVLVPDALPADGFRQLRVWLKWGRG
jgi:toxin CptA